MEDQEECVEEVWDRIKFGVAWWDIEFNMIMGALPLSVLPLLYMYFDQLIYSYQSKQVYIYMCVCVIVCCLYLL